tara:strand:+ start:2153 stop:2347 length:195 start_codon:yes stop_codon:yes gene_type:complete
MDTPPEQEILQQEIDDDTDNLEPNRFQVMFIGGSVVAMNLVLIIAYILYKTVPSVHSFISGKPL